jgi:hypothetical protein
MTYKLQEKPSAFKREHPAPQNTKFLHFLKLFLLVIFALLDLDIGRYLPVLVPLQVPKKCSSTVEQYLAKSEMI